MAVKKTYLKLGDFNEKITFERETASANSFDGRLQFTKNDLKTVWASIGFVGSPSAGSSEEEIENQRTGKMKIEVTCRWYSDLRLKFGDVIEWGGARFAIYSIQLVGKKQGYVLRAELRDDDTSKLPT